MNENSPFQIEITDEDEFYCFRLTLNPQSSHQIEIMLHARSLVELIHQASVALCDWQKQTTTTLICQKTGFTEEEARAAGLIG